MDSLNVPTIYGRAAALSVIGSMLIDEACVPLVLQKLTPEDFVDDACREAFETIRRLAADGRPINRDTVHDAMPSIGFNKQWVIDCVALMPPGACPRLDVYIPIVQRHAALYRIWQLMERGKPRPDVSEALVKRIFRLLSTAP